MSPLAQGSGRPAPARTPNAAAETCAAPLTVRRHGRGMVQPWPLWTLAQSCPGSSRRAIAEPRPCCCYLRAGVALVASPPAQRRALRSQALKLPITDPDPGIRSIAWRLRPRRSCRLAATRRAPINRSPSRSLPYALTGVCPRRPCLRPGRRRPDLSSLRPRRHRRLGLPNPPPSARGRRARPSRHFRPEPWARVATLRAAPEHPGPRLGPAARCRQTPSARPGIPSGRARCVGARQADRLPPVERPVPQGS